MTQWQRHAGWLAAALFVAAAVAAGVLFEPCSHRLHPLALPGARGVPGAAAFNLFAYVLPGALAAVAALAVYAALPAGAGWAARIGARMVLLSALAFAAQGLFPLDLQDLDGAAGQRHAMAWMAWWVAFVPGALLLAASVRGLRLAGIAAAGAVLVAAVAATDAFGAALAQRLACAAWLAWIALAPWLPRRRPLPQP